MIERNYVLPILVLLAVTGCVSGDAGHAPAPSGSGAAVEPSSAGRGAASPVRRAAFERELLLTGELEAVHSISINTPQTAVFQMRIQWMAEEGSVVRAGEPLLQFDNAALADRVLDLETQILDAETQVLSKQAETESALKDLEIELAQKEYENDRAQIDASVDADVLSRKEYGDRQLAFQKAKRELEDARARIQATRERGRAELDVLIINRDKLRKDLLSARQDLELLSIASPADGLVIYEKREGSNARYREGDSCWPGQRVIQLPDLREMQVAFFVNEVDARLLEVGMPVRITLDSFPGRELTGEVRQIPSMAVNRSDTSAVHVFRVISSLSETWPGEMKPGMSVLGHVVVERKENAPLAARASVRTDGTRYWLRRTAVERGVDPEVEVHPVARDAAWYVLDEEKDSAVLTGLGLGAKATDGGRNGAPAGAAGAP